MTEFPSFWVVPARGPGTPTGVLTCGLSARPDKRLRFVHTRSCMKDMRARYVWKDIWVRIHTDRSFDRADFPTEAL